MVFSHTHPPTPSKAVARITICRRCHQPQSATTDNTIIVPTTSLILHETINANKFIIVLKIDSGQLERTCIPFGLHPILGWTIRSVRPVWCCWIINKSSSYTTNAHLSCNCSFTSDHTVFNKNSVCKYSPAYWLYFGMFAFVKHFFRCHHQRMDYAKWLWNNISAKLQFRSN